MIEELLLTHNGIMRLRAVRERGVSRHFIECALRQGKVVRPRKGWLALPDADRALVFAASHGLILSCATQARRLGLWTRDRSPEHFAVPQAGSEVRPPNSVLHWRRPLVRREPGVLADCIENVLDNVAHCFPHEEAVAIWDSAYNKRLVDRTTMSRLPLTGAARDVLVDAIPWADSGLETYVRLRLAWTQEKILAQAWILGSRVDFRVGKYLVLQVDGGHHVGRQRTKDIAHDAILALHGYTVIRVGYDQVMNHWNDVQDLVTQAIAQGLHRYPRQHFPK